MHSWYGNYLALFVAFVDLALADGMVVTVDAEAGELRFGSSRTLWRRWRKAVGVVSVIG